MIWKFFTGLSLKQWLFLIGATLLLIAIFAFVYLWNGWNVAIEENANITNTQIKQESNANLRRVNANLINANRKVFEAESNRRKLNNSNLENSNFSDLVNAYKNREKLK